jgi:hypothetical protein
MRAAHHLGMEDVVLLLFPVFNNRVTNARNTASFDAPSPIGPGMDMYGRRIDIAFLCRHGKHRSVALVELWSAFFNANRVTIVTHHWAMSQWPPPCRARRCAECTSPEHRLDLVHRMGDLWAWASARYDTRNVTHDVPLEAPNIPHAAASAASAAAPPSHQPQQYVPADEHRHPTPRARVDDPRRPSPQDTRRTQQPGPHGTEPTTDMTGDAEQAIQQPPMRRIRPPSRDPPPLPLPSQAPPVPTPPPVGDIRLRDPRHPALTSLQYLITPEGIHRREPTETTPSGASLQPAPEGGPSLPTHTRETDPTVARTRAPPASGGNTTVDISQSAVAQQEPPDGETDQPGGQTPQHAHVQSPPQLRRTWITP